MNAKVFAAVILIVGSFVTYELLKYQTISNALGISDNNGNEKNDDVIGKVQYSLVVNNHKEGGNNDSGNVTLVLVHDDNTVIVDKEQDKNITTVGLGKKLVIKNKEEKAERILAKKSERELSRFGTVQQKNDVVVANNDNKGGVGSNVKKDKITQATNNNNNNNNNNNKPVLKKSNGVGSGKTIATAKKVNIIKKPVVETLKVKNLLPSDNNSTITKTTTK